MYWRADNTRLRKVWERRFRKLLAHAYPRSGAPSAKRARVLRGFPDEASDAELFLTELAWPEVEPFWIFENSEYLTFIGLEAFRYYMPALMLSALRQPGEFGTDLLVGLFSPHHWGQDFASLVASMTACQKRAAALFLDAMREVTSEESGPGSTLYGPGSAARSLEAYWKQNLEPL